MNLCILGWYGTETLGDRAILDGIIKIFSKYFFIKKIYIGSLYPFLTERTLFEDKDLIGLYEFPIQVFCESNVKELHRFCAKSDVVIMGGGPLMDLDQMYLIYEGFKTARKYHKYTILFGCGVGPITRTEYAEVLREIFRCTNLIIFRDIDSYKTALEKWKGKLESFVLDDPAIISIQTFKDGFKQEMQPYIAVNFREYPLDYGNSSFGVEHAANIVSHILNCNCFVKLVPMHTFWVGGDDREFLSRIYFKLHNKRVSVESKPLSLIDLYKLYANAAGCIGMRYHSVVMQTILNGNNYIIDYTGKKGKIDSF